jgi:hypothetical protein
MAFADINPDDFQHGAQAEQDKSLLVKFYYKSVEDKASSLEQGRPIFKEKTYIDIKVPGSRDGVARPASPKDIARFQRHHEAFLARVAMPQTGTPLSEWPGVSGSMVEEMSFMNIKTVEQLAELSDGLAGRFMGANSLKAKAKQWLERASKELTAEVLQNELADRDQTLVDMQLQIDELKGMLASAPKPRKSRAKAKVLPVNDDPMTEPEVLHNLEI